MEYPSPLLTFTVVRCCSGHAWEQAFFFAEYRFFSLEAIGFAVTTATNLSFFRGFAVKEKGIDRSPRTVERFLKINVIQPHRKLYWLAPPADDSASLAEQIRTVCEVYEATPAIAAVVTHVIGTDEMTCIQALEWLHPLPMQLGHVEREEFECKRYGTKSLIAKLEVATGKLWHPVLDPRARKEADFAAHITRTIQIDPRFSLCTPGPYRSSF